MKKIISLVGVLQAYSKQSSQSVKLRSLIDSIPINPKEARPEQPIPRRFIQISDEQAEMMAAEYESGIRVKDLAAKYGISRETISRRLRRQSIGPRKVGLDERQIAEAVRLYERGDSLATIGKGMGVSAQTVRSRLVEAGMVMRSSYDHLLTKDQQTTSPVRSTH